jgi:imidazolonepropionase-like amidohydrolase
MLAWTTMLFDQGVRLTVGTDAPTAWIVPGASFHDELALLRDAGIPGHVLLRMATQHAAQALGREHQLGTMRSERRAGFVLLRGEPLIRIENTRSIAAVIQGGRVVCNSLSPHVGGSGHGKQCGADGITGRQNH